MLLNDVQAQSLSEGVRRINFYRSLAGLPPALEDESVSLGCRNHARYMALNNQVTRSEDPENEWYSLPGAVAAARSNLIASPVATSESAFVDVWMQDAFQALAVLSPHMAVAGYGSFHRRGAELQSTACLDSHAAERTGTVDYPVYWPANGGSTPILQSFPEEGIAYALGNSSDPMSACPGYEGPVGPPLIVLLAGGWLLPISVSQHELRLGDRPLEHCILSEHSYRNPDPDLQTQGQTLLGSRDAVILIPRRPLQPGGVYTVSITANGEQYQWSFSARPDSPSAHP